MHFLKLDKAEVFQRGLTIGHFTNRHCLENSLGCFWKKQPDYLWHAIQFAGITARNTSKRLLLVQEQFPFHNGEFIYRIINPANLVKQFWQEQTDSGILIPRILEIDKDGSVFKSTVQWDKNITKMLLQENPFMTVFLSENKY